MSRLAVCIVGRTNIEASRGRRDLFVSPLDFFFAVVALVHEHGEVCVQSNETPSFSRITALTRFRSSFMKVNSSSMSVSRFRNLSRVDHMPPPGISVCGHPPCGGGAEGDDFT